ncbi:16S rRNA (uracil(1498)-N(3))-methyltransferase [Paracraurococcus ruber]|uniref:Ribosomal RNA small subunit methyltransferase E n=1 Tax=Paracraurococcus ruber TaxID=77675 RepID=A0ABS1D2E5_9PROT|nr:16S rRNA (uracil(1498)-N(3))-methyltransferase [Paracraurococcus ruber]MBK1660666.1 16S rRNA (uracil(1498)-N(3))-methyltransferase [Paracraurococcus ruber]TDG32627.1 16S rRNA (uracil(1498)-N(3))-methyltransferase [Paracraurococcus ruber]
MSTPRLYLDQPLEEGREIPATPGQAHHLGGVLRRGPGDAVLVFNGRDGEWAASIATLRKDRCTLLPERPIRPQEPPPDTRLLVAAVKRDAMDWMAEKATELGIGSIRPVVTRRSITDRVNQARLAAIAQEAAEQCGRLTVPAVAPAMPLHAVLDGWDGTPLLAGDERRESPPLAQVAQGLRAPWAWLVGPEGGFERAELDDLRRRAFVSTVSLGPRILRAETAAVAGLAVLQALAGDWNGR